MKRGFQAVRGIAACVVFCAAAAVGFAAPANGQGTAPVASSSDQSSISDDLLAGMYRTELRDTFRSEDAGKLLAAHRAIEAYFSVATSADRAAIAGKIEALGLDAAEVGRLLRLRMRWPALGGGNVYFFEQKRGPYDAKYFVGLPPAYDRARSWPLVVKLPSAGAFGSPPASDARDIARIYTDWIKDELARHDDAVVLMPLLDPKELYGPSYAGMNDAMQPIMDVADRVNIDPARVYLIGHSDAAQAAWNLALHFPTYFAAINPLAGAAGADWQRVRLIGLSNILPVVWCDASDNVVKPDASKSLVNALRGLKLVADLVETKGLGHTPSDAVIADCYGKARSRTRSLYPRSVSIQSNRPDSVFNRNDWVQVWQPVSPGDDRRLYFRHGGYMLVDSNTWRLDATLDGNRINVTTDNVESFRLYVNDQMVNMKEPVTVIVNRKPRFEALLKASIPGMLKDELRIGRGWRYYCGQIDIDLATPATQPATQPTTQPTTEPATHPHKGRIIVGPAADQ